MITLVRVARVLLILVLAVIVLNLIVGLGTPETGPVEKVVLVALIGGCVYCAAKVSTLAAWAGQQLSRR